MRFVVRYVKPSDIFVGGRISPTTFHPKLRERNGISVWSFDYFQRINPNDPIGELQRNHGNLQFNPNGKLVLIDVSCLNRYGLEIIQSPYPPNPENPAHMRIQSFPTNTEELENLSVNLLKCIEDHFPAG